MLLKKKPTEIPHSEDAEKATLSSLLQEPNLIHLCYKHGMDENWFWNPGHQLVYKQICEMTKDGVGVDLVTLTQWMKDRDILDQIGGYAAIAEIHSFVPTSANIEHYIGILRHKACQRIALEENREILKKVLESENVQGVFDAVASTYTKAKQLCIDPTHQKSDMDLIRTFIDDMEDQITGKKERKSIPTPLQTLNRNVEGLYPGELVVISGPKGCGKSTLGGQFIDDAVFKHCKAGAIFSIEMPYQQVMRRIISRLGNVDIMSLRKSTLSKEEMIAFNTTVNRIAKSGLSIYDMERNPMTLGSIEGEIREIKKNGELDIVLVDYLQLIKHRGGKEMRRDQIISEISSTFKRLAIEMKIVVILIAAENKGGEVRESGGVEYDADSIIQCRVNEAKETEKLWIEKWREAPPHYYIPVQLIGKYCRFVEASSNEEES